MATNATPVVDLKLSCVKVDELKTSQGGKPYLRMTFVHDDGTDKTWFSGVAFGVVAGALSKHVTKGCKVKVTGKVSQKEYQKKDGTVGIENKLVVESAKVSNGITVVTVDEFSM